MNIIIFKQFYEYNPETGLFTAKTNSLNYKINQIVGKINKQGYIQIKFNGISYKAHRLAWFYMTGKWPTNHIDHIDQDKSNNKWNNLREATKSQNGYNRGKQINNTVGIKGITYYDNSKSYGNPRYKAQISVKGRKISKSISLTPEKTEEEILNELSEWLHNTRLLICGDFAYDD